MNIGQTLENKRLFSQTEIDRYIINGGMNCPFCNSENISSLSAIELDTGYPTQKVKCLNCQKKWYEHYILAGIEVEDE